MIKLDATRSSTLVLCSKCPYFRATALDKAEGWRKGAAHEKEAHPGDKQAQKAASKYARK